MAESSQIRKNIAGQPTLMSGNICGNEIQDFDRLELREKVSPDGTVIRKCTFFKRSPTMKLAVRNSTSKGDWQS